jgi:hypothetical protein
MLITGHGNELPAPHRSCAPPVVPRFSLPQRIAASARQRPLGATVRSLTLTGRAQAAC